MGKLTVLALRAVLVVLLAGSAFIQTVMMVPLVTDPKKSGGSPPAVRARGRPGAGRGRSPRALLMGGAVVAVVGLALVVLVLRMLLTQAVARDVEAVHLRAELEVVI